MTSENSTIKSLPRKEAIAKAIEIMEFQCEIYPTLNFTTKSYDLYPIVKQTWLEDEVWKKYEIESEDYCSIPGIERNSDFITSAQELQALIEKDITNYVPETMIYQEPTGQKPDPVEMRKKSSKDDKSFEDKYGDDEVLLDAETAAKKKAEKEVLDKFEAMKKDQEGRALIEKAFGELMSTNKEQFSKLSEMIDGHENGMDYE